MANFCQQVLKPLGSYTRVFTVLHTKNVRYIYSTVRKLVIHFSQDFQNLTSFQWDSVELRNLSSMFGVIFDRIFEAVTRKLAIGVNNFGTCTEKASKKVLPRYNCLSNKAPPSIKNLVSLRSCSYNLRGDNMLALPKVNTTKYGLKSWRYFATKIWNDLQNEIRATAGKNEFVRRIRTVNF